MKKPKPVSVKTVDKLPKIAVLDQVIFNKADGFFYLGIETNEEKAKNGNNLEKTSI